MLDTFFRAHYDDILAEPPLLVMGIYLYICIYYMSCFGLYMFRYLSLLFTLLCLTNTKTFHYIWIKTLHKQYHTLSEIYSLTVIQLIER